MGGIPEKIPVDIFESKFPGLFSFEGWLPPAVSLPSLNSVPNLVSQSDCGVDWYIPESKFNTFTESLLDSIVVCKISDDVGYGIFVRLPIPSRYPVIHYSGTIDNIPVVVEDANTTFDPPAIVSNYSMRVENIYNVDPELAGGIGRFANFAPTMLFDQIVSSLEHSEFLETVQDCTISSTKSRTKITKKKIIDIISQIRSRCQYSSEFATDIALSNRFELSHDLLWANCTMNTCSIGGRIFPVLFSLVPLSPGDQILWTYSNSGYFENRGLIPGFFDFNGRYFPNALSGKPWISNLVVFTNVSSLNPKFMVVDIHSVSSLLKSSWPFPDFFSSISTNSFFLRHQLAQSGFLRSKWSIVESSSLPILDIYGLYCIPGVTSIFLCNSPDFGTSIMIQFDSTLANLNYLGILSQFRKLLNYSMKIFSNWILISTNTLKKLISDCVPVFCWIISNTKFSISSVDNFLIESVSESFIQTDHYEDELEYQCQNFDHYFFLYNQRWSEYGHLLNDHSDFVDMILNRPVTEFLDTFLSKTQEDLISHFFHKRTRDLCIS